MAYMKSYYWLICSDLKTELTSSLKPKYHTLSTWVASWLASEPIGRNPDWTWLAYWQPHEAELVRKDLG